MSLIVFGSFVLTIFLAGVLVATLALVARHGDPSASYKLFAIRDRLIDVVVFGGVPRQDEWLNAVYENVNSILIYSNLLAGPGSWGSARHVGQLLERHPEKAKQLRSLPTDSPPPEALRPLLRDLDAALAYLVRSHFGIVLQVSEQRRERRRIQRQEARQLREMLRAELSVA